MQLLTRFQLTRYVARSLCNNWDSSSISDCCMSCLSLCLCKGQMLSLFMITH